MMPMGFKNALSIFQQKMDEVINPYSKFYMVYIDDILIFSRDQEIHLQHLYLVVIALRNHSIILSE